MLQIEAENLCIEYPIYERWSRSLRHHLVIQRLGGKPTEEPRSLLSVGARIVANRRGMVVVRALDNISFVIRDGDRLGIVGHNGAGKTTLLKAIAGIYEPISGNLTVTGRISPLFNLQEGMNPDSTGRENIWLRGRILGMSTGMIASCIDDIAEFTQLGDYLEMPIRTYSSGMLVRLAFAIATSVKHEILLMDEMIGAGDATFIEKAEARLRDFVEETGIMVVASHSPSILRRWCNKAMLLHHGHLILMSSVDEVLTKYAEVTAQ